MNSPGGNLFAALKLGELFRRHGFSPSLGGGPYAPSDELSLVADYGGDSINMRQVPVVCSSACAYAFLGGLSRSFSDEDKFGVHQFFSQQAVSAPTEKAFDATDLSLQQVVTGLIVDYVVRMGVDARLVSEASRAFHNDLRFLTVKEATELRVIYDPNSFTPWTILPRGTAVVARSNSQDGNMIAQVACFRRRGQLERKFAFWFKGSDAESWRQVALASRSFSFAGMTISTSQLKIETDGTSIYFSRPAVQLRAARREF